MASSLVAVIDTAAIRQFEATAAAWARASVQSAFVLDPSVPVSLACARSRLLMYVYIDHEMQYCIS